MRGQEQEEEEIRGTGYEFRKMFCSLQPRGFAEADPGGGGFGGCNPPFHIW